MREKNIAKGTTDPGIDCIDSFRIFCKFCMLGTFWIYSAYLAYSVYFVYSAKFAHSSWYPRSLGVMVMIGGVVSKNTTEKLDGISTTSFTLKYYTEYYNQVPHK